MGSYYETETFDVTKHTRSHYGKSHGLLRIILSISWD